MAVQHYWVELAPDPTVLGRLRKLGRVTQYIDGQWAVVRFRIEGSIAEHRERAQIPLAARVSPCGPRDGSVQARQGALFVL